MKILIIGGTGLIGSKTVPILRQGGQGRGRVDGGLYGRMVRRDDQRRARRFDHFARQGGPNQHRGRGGDDSSCKRTALSRCTACSI